MSKNFSDRQAPFILYDYLCYILSFNMYKNVYIDTKIILIFKLFQSVKHMYINILLIF